jgi:hypothetical protein
MLVLGFLDLHNFFANTNSKSMSLNFERIGKFLCKVEGGRYDRKIISVSSEIKKEDKEDKYSKPFSSLKIEGGSLQQVPDPDTERQILYITGASGSGKSTYTKNYIKNYKKMFPKRVVYLFSALKTDESLDEVNPQRIVIDDSLVEVPLTAEDFKDSIVIFDDTDCISNKKHRNAVNDILNEILETGRHFNTSCILTFHLATGGRDTRKILNESHSVIYFPHSGSNVGLKRLLVDYLGLDKKTMKKIKDSKSRWACIFRNYPNVVMTERDIWLPSNDDDD